MTSVLAALTEQALQQQREATHTIAAYTALMQYQFALRLRWPITSPTDATTARARMYQVRDQIDEYDDRLPRTITLDADLSQITDHLHRAALIEEYEGLLHYLTTQPYDPDAQTDADTDPADDETQPTAISDPTETDEVPIITPDADPAAADEDPTDEVEAPTADATPPADEVPTAGDTPPAATDPILCVFPDTETTGFGQYDQIVEIAFVANTGEVLLNTRIALTRHGKTVPPQSTAVHGITTEDLANAPSFMDVWPQIRDIISKYPLLIYNAEFDLKMLEQTYRQACPNIKDAESVADINLIKSLYKSSLCVMHLFADLYGYWDERKNGGRWMKLAEACNYQNFKIAINNIHSAYGDADATRRLALRMRELRDWDFENGKFWTRSVRTRPDADDFWPFGSKQ